MTAYMSSPTPTGLTALLLLTTVAMAVRGEHCRFDPPYPDHTTTELMVKGCGCWSARVAGWGGADPRVLTQLDLQDVLNGSELSFDCLKDMSALADLRIAGPLQHNRITYTVQPGSLHNLHAITKLTVKNLAGEPCHWLQDPTLEQLTLLTLANVPSRRMCFQKWNKLVSLTISSGVFNLIQFSGLPIAGRENTLRVQLKDSNVQNVQLNMLSYNALKNATAQPVVSIFISAPLTLYCSPQYQWLQFALREGVVTVDKSVLCEDGVPLVDSSLDYRLLQSKTNQ